MAIKVNTRLPEGSTRIARLSIADTNGVAAEDSDITACRYKWSNINGTAINDRGDVAADATAIVDIKLTPDDLTVTETAAIVNRLLTVTWTYNDINLGDGATEVKEYIFEVENYVNK